MGKLPLHPWYDTSKVLYYFVWIFFIIYAVGTLVFFIFIQNNSVVYTWFANPGSPGTELTSKRGSFIDVMVRLSVVAHIMFCGLIASMVLNRKNYGCNIFWVIIIALAILTTMLCIFALSADYVNCNAQNQFGNLCNDLNWCNVNEIRANTNNRCPDPSPSPTPALFSSLSPKVDFLGLFWVNVCLCVFEIVYLSILSYYWSLESEYEIIPSTSSPEEEQDIKSEMKTEEDVPKIKYRSPPKKVQIRLSSAITTHGLKQRK